MTDTTGKASKPLELLAFDPQLKAGLTAVRKVSIYLCGQCA
jgi:hypothetical protein